MNLWDHLGLIMTYIHEIGAAVGSPKWVDPLFQNENPIDWFTTSSVPREGLKAALSKIQGLIYPMTMIFYHHHAPISPFSCDMWADR
jgi:hypothetical protein